MKYRKLDADGDYCFGYGESDFVSGADAVKQAIQTNLLLLYGEWWESVDEGLPLFQNILGQSGGLEHVQAVDLLVQGRILETTGVNSIKDFSSSYDTTKRIYQMACTVETQYGDVTVPEVKF